jgi:hypothetical protein
MNTLQVPGALDVSKFALLLASEALPMLNIYTLARLISLLQFREVANYVLSVGNNYVSHMAAMDMTMSMAAVILKNATGPGVQVLA